MSTDTADPMARYRDFHPVYDLERLRDTLAKLADLPGDTPISHGIDDGNEATSYKPATEVQVTHWNGYERCAEGDEDAELGLFFILPAEHPDGVAGEGSFHPIGSLAELRDATAKLADLPGDMPVWRTEDGSNDEDSFDFAELQVAWWDGAVQCEEGDKGARKALFVI
jgi:hypothetical protein